MAQKKEDNILLYSFIIIALFIGGAIGTGYFSGGGTSGDSSGDSSNSVLIPNGELKAGQSLTNGNYTFVMQDDGNAVLYDGGVVKWATNTENNSGASLVFQEDNNIVIYKSGLPIWATETAGTDRGGNSRLKLESNGKLVMYGDGGGNIWDEGFSLMPKKMSREKIFLIVVASWMFYRVANNKPFIPIYS